MRYKRKTKQNRKKRKVYFYAEKHRMCTQKIRKSKYTQKITELQNTRIHSILVCKSEMLLKFIVGNFCHVGGVS